MSIERRGEAININEPVFTGWVVEVTKPDGTLFYEPVRSYVTEESARPAIDRALAKHKGYRAWRVVRSEDRRI